MKRTDPFAEMGMGQNSLVPRVSMTRMKNRSMAPQYLGNDPIFKGSEGDSR